MLNIIQRINSISRSHWYWLMYIIGSLVLLTIALYFQHVKDELPCVVCIQIRLWISLLLLMSIIGLLSLNSTKLQIFSHISVVLIAIGFTERSYLLLGTERGFIFADCGFDLGMPAWFAIDNWLPDIYRVETSCGYTPELLLGITMAEALMVMSVTLLFIGTCVLFARIINVIKAD